MDIKDLLKSKISLESMVTVVSLFAVLSIGYIATDYLGYKENQAFAQNNNTITNTETKQQQQQQQQQTQTTFPANFTRAMGSVSSIQDNENGQPTWILSGQWDMAIPKPLKINQTNPPDAAAFNAAFEMIKTHGTEAHTHTVSNFNMTGSEINGNALDLAGYATVSMKEGQIYDVYMTLSIVNQGAVKIMIDPSKTDFHFGNEPIFGTVSSIGTFLSFPR